MALARELLSYARMGSANAEKSGSYLVDMSSADDLWRKLADTTPAPTLQRVSRGAARPPQFARAETTTTGGVEKIRAVQNKSAGFVQSGWDKMRPPSVEVPSDPWSRGERRLWFAAGTLMAGAVAVLTVFALVTFGGVRLPVPSESAAMIPAPPSSAPEATAPAAAPAPAPATVQHDANTFRPPLPARVRSEATRAPTVARKHVKHHKAKRTARD